MAVKKEMKFEQAMSRLEEIVQALDGGEKSLNDSLLLFEEGVKLTRECSRQLDDAKGRVETLVKGADGSISTTPLEV